MRKERSEGLRESRWAERTSEGSESTGLAFRGREEACLEDWRRRGLREEERGEDVGGVGLVALEVSPNQQYLDPRHFNTTRQRRLQY